MLSYDARPSLTAAAGFMGSSDAAQRHPSYEDVCTGKSGHVEVLQLNWNPAATSYDVLVAHFLTFHDPTTRDRQGNDAGPQYASVVFAHNEEQAATARERLGKLQTLLDGGKVSGFLGAKVVTEVLPAREFTPASAKHQRYLERNPNGAPLLGRGNGGLRRG